MRLLFRKCGFQTAVPSEGCELDDGIQLAHVENIDWAVVATARKHDVLHARPVASVKTAIARRANIKQSHTRLSLPEQRNLLKQLREHCNYPIVIRNNVANLLHLLGQEARSPRIM